LRQFEARDLEALASQRFEAQRDAGKIASLEETNEGKRNSHMKSFFYLIRRS
jgi:hypothetical protein